MKQRIVDLSKISGDGINYVVVLALLHICTALRETDFYSECYLHMQLLHENRNISAYDSIEISTKRVVAPSQYD